MAFAWLFVHSFLDIVHIFHIDEGQDPVLTHVLAALLTSFCAFSLIRVFAFTLDCAAGSPITDDPSREVKRLLQIDANRRAMGQLVSSIGMLIGLSWEKAFDHAIETVAEMAWLSDSLKVPKLGFFLLSIFLVRA